MAYEPPQNVVIDARTWGCDSCGWRGKRGRRHRCPRRAPQVYGPGGCPNPRKLRGNYSVKLDEHNLDIEARSLKRAARIARQLDDLPEIYRYSKSGGITAVSGRWTIEDGRPIRWTWNKREWVRRKMR